ncbi:MAG: TonB-dependent receptor [Sphingobacteriaceae bacterium]|nr:TonB-dependent receptor [Sphingobacteriaceae bacterium]
MRPFLFFIISIFSLNSATAQMPVGGAPTITGRISGTVIDSITQKPIDYVTVGLGRASSTKSTNGALTDQKGIFKIDNVAPGNYKVTITFIGYQTKIIAPVTTTPGKPDLNLGKIILSPSATALKEIAITGQAALIENRVDKVVYNAEKDATVTGGNAGDVLRKVPMVSVDQDGNVSLRGSQNIKVLINGKPSGAMASNVADAMKMLPADQIKSVEVVTSPSAKYDAEGSAGIINIITKKSNMSGVSGSISGGVGTRQNNGNANLNVNQNRLSVSGNFGGNYTWPQMSTIDFRSLDTRSIRTQNGKSETERYSGMGSGNVSYDFNSSNSISSGIRIHQGGFSTDGSSLNSNTPITSSAIQSFIIDNNSKMRFNGFDWNSDYTRKFKKAGHEISLAGQWSHGKSQTDYTTLYTNFNPNQIAANDGINDEYTIQADYSLPINEKVKIEAGVKTILRDITSNSLVQISNAAGVYQVNDLMSNDYLYTQNVYSGYGVLSFQLPKSYGIQVGGRVENTKIEGEENSPNPTFDPFSNSYTNFIPSLAISKTVKKNTFRLSYSKRIQRPSLHYLNPFKNTSNALAHSTGNPYLSPEVTQSVELNFSTFIKSSIVNASFYYKHIDDVIESLVRSDLYQTKGKSGNDTLVDVSLTNFANIGKNNSIGGSFFGQISPVKSLTFRTNVNLFSYTPQASSSFQESSANVGTQLLYNAFVSGSVNLPKNFVTETFVIINSPRRTFQGKNPAFNMWIVSFSKQVLNKKGKIGLNIIDPFNERKNFRSEITSSKLTQSSNFSMPFRSFGVTFSWQFGKMNFNAQPKKKRGVNNDDLKQDGGQGGQGM